MLTPRTLETGFDAGAARYDLLTALNPGYHAALHEAAARVVVGPPVRHEPLLLDVGCGSGLSTRALLDVAQGPVRVIGVDASAGMLGRARAKRWPAGVQFRHGRAQDLPELLAGEPAADGVLAAYLLRNVPAQERDEAIGHMVAAVRPGGVVVLHEYSVAGRPLARLVWTLVCLSIVLPLATALRGNPSLYVYLWRSVLAMEPVDVVEDRLRRAGLIEVRTTTTPGWSRGILHTISGRRPA